MSETPQTTPNQSARAKRLPRGVFVLTLMCLGVSLAPAIFIAAIAPGYVTESDAALVLFIFSPLWAPLLMVLQQLWVNKQERALGIAIAVGSGGVVLGVCALTAVIFFFFRRGVYIAGLDIPVVGVGGVLGLFGALRSSALAARCALLESSSGSEPSAPPPRIRRWERSWNVQILVAVVSGAGLLFLFSNLGRQPAVAPMASSVSSLRTINTACVTYASTYERVGFLPALENLGPVSGNPATEERADLIDATLAAGTKSGYRFRYVAGPRVDGVIATYTVNADPIKAGESWNRHLFTDQTAVIRVEQDKPATADSPPLY
jgi:type IV pilus assembly protein PilA